MVSCQKCGNELPIDHARFCDMCGTSVIHSNNASNLSQDVSTHPEDNLKSRFSNRVKIGLILIGVIIIVGIMAGSYFAYIGNQNTNTDIIGSNGLEQGMTEPIIDSVYMGQSELRAGEVVYYTITVPSNAISAILSGTYHVMDVAIFSLSLMGINWRDYILEAKRCLVTNGTMLIAETTKSLKGRLSQLRAYLKQNGFEIYIDEERGDFTLIESRKIWSNLDYLTYEKLHKININLKSLKRVYG